MGARRRSMASEDRGRRSRQEHISVNPGVILARIVCVM